MVCLEVPRTNAVAGLLPMHEQILYLQTKSNLRKTGSPPRWRGTDKVIHKNVYLMFSPVKGGFTTS